MDITLLAIDIAKNVFHCHGVNGKGKQLLRKKLTRKQLLPYMANFPSCTIVMEACGGANYWYREFIKLGHEVKLINASYVKPYVKTNKNDYNDAEAIAEAASRENMRFVSPKTIEQQDIQSIHRIRKNLVENRTGLSNQIRGLLAEYGVIFPQGIRYIRNQISGVLEDAENDLTMLTRELISDLYGQLCILDEKIKEYDQRVKLIFKQNEACQRISCIEGVGVLTATALIAAVGDPNVFKNGRHFAAWLGLVPKQKSTGGKQVLLGISKRGDSYLRSLLISGARAAMKFLDRKTESKYDWLKAVVGRAGRYKAAVALANKNARVIWALLASGEAYKAA